MSKNTKRKIRYTKELCRRMYIFFIQYEDRGAPSVEKFARSIGATAADIEAMRRYARFDRAYRECCEIRRDYLIDRALDRRFDPSFVKFLISAEGESGLGDGDFKLHLEVAE